MIRKTLLLLVSLTLVGSASAAWKKVDDAETPAKLDEWTTTSTGLDTDPNIVPGKVEYVADPVNSGQGTVISIVNPIGTDTGSNSSMTLPLGDAAIKDDFANPDKKQTLYFKLLRPLVNGTPGELNTTIGLMSSAEWATTSGVSPAVNEAPDTIPSWGQYSSIVRYETDGIFDIRDGGTYHNISDTAQDTDVWYEVWMVHSHGQGEYQVYLKGGNDYPEQTLVTKELVLGDVTQFAGDTAAYRVVTFEDLDWLFIKPNGGGSAQPEGRDNTYIDDIYMDNDGENLSSPAGGGGSGWALVDDFEGYADQAGLEMVWTQDNDPDGEGGGVSLGADPFDAGNQVLDFAMGATTAESGTYNVRAYRAIPNIEPNSGKTTFYFRYGVPSVMDGSNEVPGVVDLVWGLSPVDDPTAYGDYAPLGRQEFNQSFDIYNTDTYVELVETLPGNVWYEMWWVVDTDTRTVDVHVKGGDTYTEQTLVADDFGWRNQTIEAIDRFLLTSSAGTLIDPKGLDSALIDDIYVSAGENLSAPSEGGGGLPPGDAEFLNISTRGQVGTGADLLIGGFVVKGVEGADTGTVLIRAVGPTLGDFGLTGVLEDPILTFFDQADPGTPLGSNDDWGSQSNAEEIKAAMAAVGAFPLADDSKDAVVLVALPPGAYTAQISGKDGTALGVAIIEVYAVD